MSTTESEKKLKMEEAAFHDLRENLAIYADQLQDEAAENHCGVGAYLHPSSDSTEFFMLHSVEDGRLTGAYHFGSVPIFRVDRHAPAELSAALVDLSKDSTSCVVQSRANQSSTTKRIIRSVTK